jgi:hypothetical protein
MTSKLVLKKFLLLCTPSHMFLMQQTFKIAR